MARFGRICQEISYLRQNQPIFMFSRSLCTVFVAQNNKNLKCVKNRNIESKRATRIPLYNYFAQRTDFLRMFGSIIDNHDDGSQKYIAVKNYTFKVPSFGGSVIATSPIDLTVRSADPAHYHNLDHSSIRLLSCSKSENHQAKLDARQDNHKLTVQCSAENPTRPSDYKLDVEVPIVHNVKVSALNNACVDVHDFIESNFVDITSETGQVTTQQIKTENLTIRTISGDIICQGTLQGDVKVSSYQGNIISSKRFMGPNLELDTDNGDIRVASSYSDQAKFSTNKGSMNLRNIHNESFVAVYDQGDVKIQGLDGSTNIFIKKGDLDVHVSRIRHESRIHVEDGDVHLKLSDSYPIKISIDANDIITDSKLSEHGKFEKRIGDELKHFSGAIEPNKFSPTLVVVAENGTVEIEMQDWPASLGVQLRS